MYTIDPPPNPTQCVDTFEIVGPLISTKWGQENGYNNYLETRNSLGCSGEGNIPAGCATIAIAQVMKYHCYPQNAYSWNLMPNNYATQTTQLFIKDILDHLDHYHNCNGTSSNLNDAMHYLTDSIGYWQTIHTDYNYETIFSELRQNRPVILRGQDSSSTYGHVWVCDGFNRSVFCLFDSNGNYLGTEIYIYLSMNWGFNGEADGLYANYYFNPSIGEETLDLNYTRQILYNIGHN